MHTPQTETIGNSLVFVADSINLLVKLNKNGIDIPCIGDFDTDITKSEHTEYLGTIGEQHCFCLCYGEDIHIPEGMVFKNLREILEAVDDDLSIVVQRAVHIAHWTKVSKYCGVCGNSTRKCVEERARVCNSCGNVIYPRISPAIIIAIIREGKILLAHNKNFPEGRFSLIAGFMEPGETFEDTAIREVREEVGIKIKNIRYFASQPWPFPDSLMIGLTAEYDSGEITPDGDEIDKAGWFGVHELPRIPGTISIAGKLIEWFAGDNADSLETIRW